MFVWGTSGPFSARFSMSAIGGNIGSLNIVGSLAGAQRNNAADGELKTAAAERQFQLDQKAMSAKSLGDVAQMDHSSDRDADGRMPYQAPERTPAAAEQDENKSRQSVRHAPDALGERGCRLDLEA